jgi:hypothetical protein
MDTPAEEENLKQLEKELIIRWEEEFLLEHEENRRKVSAEEPIRHQPSILSSPLLWCTFMYGFSAFLTAGLYYFVNAQLRR